MFPAGGGWVGGVPLRSETLIVGSWYFMARVLIPLYKSLQKQCTVKYYDEI